MAKRQLKIKLNKDTMVLFLIVLTIVVLIFVIIPRFSQIKELHSSVNLKKAELEYTLAKNSDISWINSQSTELQQKISTINNLYVKKSEGIDFIAEIENLALDLGIAEPQKNIDDTEVTEKVTPITLQLTVNGSWQQIMQYINSLEKMDKIVDIEQLKISTKQTDDTSQTSVEAHIFTTTYWII